jgi:hypothetical protein
VSKIRVLTTISRSTLSIVVITLVGRGKSNLNLKFLGIGKGAMDDGEHN